MSQRTEILNFLKTRKQLTPLEALKRFGCMRLGARIWELKQDGHRIHTSMVEVGNEKRVGSYLLIKQAKRAA
jgi:hypothetical protein